MRNREQENAQLHAAEKLQTPVAQRESVDVPEHEVTREHDGSMIGRLVKRLVELGRSSFRGTETSPEILRDEVEKTMQSEFRDPPATPFFQTIKEHPWMKKGVLPLVGALSILLMSDIARAEPNLSYARKDRQSADGPDDPTMRLRVELERKIEQGERLPIAYPLGASNVLETTEDGKTRSVRYLTPSRGLSSGLTTTRFDGLFRGWTAERFNRTLDREGQIINELHDGGMPGFHAALREAGEELSEESKLFLLSRFGGFMSLNYDDNGVDTGAISLERMVRYMAATARTGRQRPLGQCRQIALSLGNIAADMGFRSFVTDMDTRANVGHIVTGVEMANGEIIFVDYDTVIPTGSTHLRDAARVLEMYYGATKMRYTAYNNEGKPRAVYFSRASEDMRDAASMVRGLDLLDHTCTAGEDARVPVDIFVSQEKSEVTVQKDGSFLGVVHFDRSRDPLNALLTMDALRFGRRRTSANDAASRSEAVLTYVAARHKDPFHSKENQGDIQQNILLNFSLSEAVRLNVSRTITSEMLFAFQMAAQYSISGSHMTDRVIGSGMSERMTYLDPRSPRSFYVEAGAFAETVEPDVQENTDTLFEAGLFVQPHAKVGGVIPVREARLSFDTVLEGGYHRRSLTLKPEIVVGQWRGSAALTKEYGNSASVSSEKKLRIELEQKGIRIGDLKGAITIYGAEEHRSGDQDGLEFGAQLRILF